MLNITKFTRGMLISFTELTVMLPAKHCIIDMAKLASQEVALHRRSSVASYVTHCCRLVSLLCCLQVCPWIKKPSFDACNANSYRPIKYQPQASVFAITRQTSQCNSCHCCMLSRTTCFQQTSQHVDVAVLPKQQSLSILYNNFAPVINAGLLSALVMLDLHAAFDTVDHTVLLSVLEDWFFVHDVPLVWFCSYLFGRSETFCTVCAVGCI